VTDDEPQPADDALDDGALNGRREVRMAARVAAALVATPAARLFVLTGNLHARTVRGGVPFGADYAPLGAILAARHPLTSLELTYRGGTAWCCVMNPDLRCGPQPVNGHDRGAGRQVIWYARPDEVGYHGALYVGDLTASPPAVPEDGKV
jgi:hypothetical protein